MGDSGGTLDTSSRSGVRERPTESLKLFSLGMAFRAVVVVNEGGNYGIESSCPRLCNDPPPGVHQVVKQGSGCRT